VAANILVAVALLFVGLLALGMRSGGARLWRRFDFWIGLILLLAAAAAPVRYFTRAGAAETRVAFSEPVLVWMAAVIAVAGCYALYLVWLLLRRSTSPVTLADERASAGVPARPREVNAAREAPLQAMPAPADTEAAFADLAAALREQLSTNATQPSPLPRSHAGSETLSLPDAQPLESPPGKLRVVASAVPGTIQLRIRRFHRSAETPGGDALFACEARLELTSHDAELVRRYGLMHQVIFEGQGRSASDETVLRVSVESLMRGHRVDCQSFAELLTAEQAFVEACKTLRACLDLAANLDGAEEVLRF
jgi:hypothetical protein